MEIKGAPVKGKAKHWRDGRLGGDVSFGRRAQFTVAWKVVCFEEPRTMMDWRRQVHHRGAAMAGLGEQTRGDPLWAAVLAYIWASALGPYVRGAFYVSLLSRGSTYTCTRGSGILRVQDQLDPV